MILLRTMSLILFACVVRVRDGLPLRPPLISTTAKTSWNAGETPQDFSLATGPVSRSRHAQKDVTSASSKQALFPVPEYQPNLGHSEPCAEVALC